MLTKLFLTAAIVGLSVSSYAQGFVTFNTRVLGQTARCYDTDGNPLGANWLAQLYVADGANAPQSSLVAKGTPVPFGTTASTAGYVQTSPPFNAAVAVASGAGPVTIQMRAWSSDFADYNTASSTLGGKFGISNLITVNATAAPATPPNLVGLIGFGVPEPGTIAMGLMGVAALLFRRRK